MTYEEIKAKVDALSDEALKLDRIDDILEEAGMMLGKKGIPDLTRIALEDEWPDNRLVAVQCLTDLDALRRVASESRDSNLREKAAAIIKANEPKKAESRAGSGAGTDPGRGGVLPAENPGGGRPGDRKRGELT